MVIFRYITTLQNKHSAFYHLQTQSLHFLAYESLHLG